MNKLFEKHETLYCVFLIILYVVVNAVCVQNFGYTSWVGFVVNAVFSACLLGLVFSLKKAAYYGFTKVRNAKQYLYFLPLAVIVSVNLWSGFHVNHSASEIVFHVLTMIHVGFLEEVIFRGFLFRMMEKSNRDSAILVSAVTFGMGHVVNLLNGAEVLPTVIQIVYATAIGYLFVILFYKSKSLIPCILTHCLVNALSIFNVENTVTLYIAPVCLTVIPLGYAWYIKRSVKE